MFESIDPPRRPLGLKRPLIAFAISVGAIVVGSAVCTPGICGCTSWTGLSFFGYFGEAGIFFLFLSLAGVLGAVLSLFWLTVKAVRGELRRRS
jgi:hypothetical protein